MIISPKASELHPTGELREWYWISFDHVMVRGKVYNHLVYEDGSIINVINITKIVDYRDHFFVITQSDDYFKLEYTHRNMNGV